MSLTGLLSFTALGLVHQLGDRGHLMQVGFVASIPAEAARALH